MGIRMKTQLMTMETDILIVFAEGTEVCKCESLFDSYSALLGWIFGMNLAYPTGLSPSIYGNSKRNKPYQWLSVRQNKIIASSLDTNKTPKEIKDEIHTHIPEVLLTLKAARKAQYNYLNQKHPQDKQNLADDIITVLNKCYDDTSFVQGVLTSSKNKPQM